MESKTRDSYGPLPDVDWKKLWDDMDVWFQDRSSPERCKICGHIESDAPEWPDQQAWIQRAVNAQLRGKR